MVGNEVRRFSTMALPEDLRGAAWAEVFEALAIVDCGACGRPPDGCVVACASSQGSVFVQMSASPLALRPGPRHEAGESPVLVLVLSRGAGEVMDGATRQRLSAGDIALLDPSRNWSVEMHTEFSALLVRLESATFLRRLIRTSDAASRISTRTGVGALCLNLLGALSEELGYIGRDELPTLEAVLSQMLVAGLSSGPAGDARAGEASTAVQITHLRRVCRAVDTRLADPALCIEHIAASEGLSARYIQKLFKLASTSFGAYLRARRLDRCRMDLANPALAHFSISELCFRWGFNDAGNFSRAFSARFGQTPKACRAEASLDAVQSASRRGRPGTPGRAGRVASDPAVAAIDEAARRRSRFLDLFNDGPNYPLALALSPKRHSLPFHDGAAAASHHYYLPASLATVHWGYFSRALPPVLTVRTGDVVTIETLTQHATDDCERMIWGDAGAQSVFEWTAHKKAVDRRGAGPMDAGIYGRGAGEGFGVHICTGPIYIQDAEPGDVLEIRILDIVPRPSCHPEHRGRVFGSNAAAWWGFQYDDLITEPKKREVVTIYEIVQQPDMPHAKAVYSYRWTPQTDPFGVRHDTIDYPGVPVDHTSIEKRFDVLMNAEIPIRPHFGVMAVAPREADTVDSIPPSYFGGNLDNWRAGKGARLFLPVSVPGALFSVGDPHASQGDSEACGTAIECSLTGSFQFVLHKRAALGDGFLAELRYPFLETPEEWVLQGLSFPDYQAELGADAQTQVYKKSSLEAAMRDAFRKVRHYLMTAHGLSEDEAISLISVAVDFGITQVVDGNIGVHAIVRKKIFRRG